MLRVDSPTWKMTDAIDHRVDHHDRCEAVSRLFGRFVLKQADPLQALFPAQIQARHPRTAKAPIIFLQPVKDDVPGDALWPTPRFHPEAV
jgi:hypothetical protein